MLASAITGAATEAVRVPVIANTARVSDLVI
jgi:hypothetical protein